MDCNKCECNLGTVCQACLPDSKLPGCNPFEDEIEAWYEVQTTFTDTNGKEYSTNDWSEEEVLLEVSSSSQEEILNKVFEYAYTVADNLLIFERHYDLLTDYDDEVDVIDKLKISKIYVSQIRYEYLDKEIEGSIDGMFTKVYE